MNLLKEPLNDTTIEKIRSILFDTVQNSLRHQHYDHVVELFKKCYAYTTGKGLDFYLRQFRQREDEALFKQRVELTSHILPAVINNCDFLLNKVPRSYALHLNYVNTDETKQTNLKEAETHYFADKSVEEYFKKYNRWYDRSDPNAWLITEFNSTDGTELAQPYPFVVNSKQAINFEFINGLLNWLIVEVEKDFTIYTPNQNIKLEYICDVNSKPEEKDNYIFSRLVEDGQIMEVDGEEYIRLNSKIYEIYMPEAHNIGWVQARRWGYNFDGATYGETYVPFWWEAECYLTKIININSELDITLARHNFPQKLVYSPRCHAEGCNHGYLPDNTKCNHCGGTGLQPVHTTAQDCLVIALPDNKEEMIDLNTLIAYIYPPIDGMQFTNEKITELVKNCKEAIYNSDTYTKSEVAETATGLNIGMESIYDTLYHYAINYAESWAFTVKTVAKITTTDSGLIVTSNVEKDFKFKTKNELIAELNQAKLAGADPSIIRALQNDIMFTMFSEKPSEFIKYQIKDKFNPFSGKTNEEIIALMASNNIPKYVKILYSNYGYIFDELERENKGFYDYEETKQLDLIRKKVEQITGTLEQAPTLDLSNPE